MGNPRSRQPAHVRPVRRSLVELTADAVSSAARDGVRVTSPAPIATFFEDVKAGETAAENSDQLTTSITVAPPATGHAEASAVIQLPHPAAALTPSARAISNSADGTTEMAVEAAEDRRAPVRQKLKVSVSASPGDLNDIASPELPTGPALEEPATQEANSSHDAVNSEKTIPAATISAIVADYQAKALGLTEANMSATLEFAQQLVNLRSASDLIKLSSTHARTQIELMIKQSSVLRSLAMNLTPSYDTLTAADPQVLTKSTSTTRKMN
jgi:Phasin protein